MIASLYLLGGLLIPAQVMFPTPPSRPPQLERHAVAPSLPGEYVLGPRLVSGQELVYRGTFTEQSGSGGVQLHRVYRVETRAFVLESGLRGVDLALLTLLREQTVAGERPGDRIALKPADQGEVRSARLERLFVDLQGKPSAGAGVSLIVPLEGPPLLESGFCVAVPPGKLGLQKPWTVSDAGRPEMTWRIVGAEVICGASCLRLEGTQQSDDWARPRGGKPAWRRRDTVWVSGRNGVAQRLDRRIEHRPAGREDVDHLSILNYDLQSALQYPATLADDRRRELFQSLQLYQTMRPLLSQTGRPASQFDVAIARVKGTHDAHADTPYREALAQLRVRLEMAKRGETPPSLPTEVTVPAKHEEPQAMVVGKRAPDFVAAEMNTSGRSQGLKHWRGRPILLFFFNPESRCLQETLQLLHTLADEHKEVALVGLAMAGDAGHVDELRSKRGWKMPVLSGAGLRITYAVDSTPKLVFIDTDGIVQGVVEGWGSETASEIAVCLARWIRR